MSQAEWTACVSPKTMMPGLSPGWFHGWLLRYLFDSSIRNYYERSKVLSSGAGELSEVFFGCYGVSSMGLLGRIKTS